MFKRLRSRQSLGSLDVNFRSVGEEFQKKYYQEKDFEQYKFE